MAIEARPRVTFGILLAGKLATFARNGVRSKDLILGRAQ